MSTTYVPSLHECGPVPTVETDEVCPLRSSYYLSPAGESWSLEPARNADALRKRYAVEFHITGGFHRITEHRTGRTYTVLAETGHARGMRPDLVARILAAHEEQNR